jgi:hypothetical protein
VTTNTPTCDRPGCFNRTMIPVKGMAAELYECPLCGAMADAAPTVTEDDQ